MKSTTQNIKAIRLQFGDLTITAEVEARLEELGFTPETLIDAIGEHKSDCSGNPSIYCGTYGKYSGEEDPELMFQDYEAFPREWYSEGFMSRKTSSTFGNITICATSTVRMPWTTIWSSATISMTSRKPTAVIGTAKKPSDATCSCTTTRWAQTTTCSAWSDLVPLSSFKSSLHKETAPQKLDTKLLECSSRVGRLYCGKLSVTFV